MSTTLESKKYHGYTVFSNGEIINRFGKKLANTLHAGGVHIRNGIVVNGKTKHMLRHRIVAECFIPNPQNLPIVRHADETIKPRDNSVQNLYWGTIQENRQDLSWNITNNPHIFKKGLKRPVTMIDTNAVETFFPSMTEASHSTKINSGSIYNCATKKYKSAGGYKWEFTEPK